MTQSNRADLFDALAELRRRYPEWRLGQLISNVAGWADKDVWDIEDEQLLEAINEHLSSSVQSKHETPA